MRSACLLVVPLLLLCSCAATGGPATTAFNAESAQAIALSPYYLDETRSEFDLATQLTQVSAAHEPFTGLLQPVLLVVGAVADTLEAGPAAAQGAATGCRGSYTPQLTEPGDGSYRGSLEFDGFSPDCGPGMTGRLQLHGRRTAGGGAYTAELELGGLELLVGDRRYAVQGEIELQRQADGMLRAAVNLRLTGPDRLQHQLRNVQLSWGRQLQYPSIAIDGTLVHGRYGTCRVETEAPLLLNPQSRLPFDGMLRYHLGQEQWARLYFPMYGFPGRFRVDSSGGMQSMGKL